ncbi:MAG TPA: hypothetical protein VGC88_12690 [Terriglobales bacterium]|jgi:hypothetical protein
MRALKSLLAVCGIYGIVVLFPLYFLEGRIGRDNPPAITHPEYFYGFVGIGLVWQLAILLVARDPLRYRSLLGLCVIEKLSFGIAGPVLAIEGRSPQSLVAFGAVDVLMAVAFAYAFLRLGRVEHRLARGHAHS